MGQDKQRAEIKVRVFEMQRWIVSARGGKEMRGDETSGNIWPGRMRASSRLISLQRRMQLFPSFITQTLLLVCLSLHCLLPIHSTALLYVQGQSYINILEGWLVKK